MTNLLRNIYTIRMGARNISIKYGELTFLKLKSCRLSYILDENMPFGRDKSKSKKGALVPKEFALFYLIEV